MRSSTCSVSCSVRSIRVPGWGAKMQLDQADIGAGEEVEADDGGQAPRDHQQGTGADQHEHATVQSALQQPAIDVAKTIEAAIEESKEAARRSMVLCASVQQIARE